MDANFIEFKKDEKDMKNMKLGKMKNKSQSNKKKENNKDDDLNEKEDKSYLEWYKNTLLFWLGILVQNDIFSNFFVFCTKAFFVPVRTPT